MKITYRYSISYLVLTSAVSAWLLFIPASEAESDPKLVSQATEKMPLAKKVDVNSEQAKEGNSVQAENTQALEANSKASTESALNSETAITKSDGTAVQASEPAIPAVKAKKSGVDSLTEGQKLKNT